MATLVAHDGGFSAVKIMDNDGNRASIPSVIGSPIQRSNFELEGNGITMVENGGTLYPVGGTALMHSSYSSGSRDSSWVTGKEWMRLFKAGLSELFTAPYTKVKLITGLPVYDWEDYKDELRDNLMGELAFRRLGRDRQLVNITDCAVITQPYGSLIAMAMDKNGRSLHNVWSDGYVGVADIGGLTLNFLTVDQLREIHRLTSSDEFGLLAALDGVRDSIRHDLRRLNPDTHEVSEWLARGWFQYQGERIDIAKYAQPHMLPLVESVMGRIKSAWPESGRFDAILLTGGGNSAIGRYLKARMSTLQDGHPMFANVHVMEDARWGNAKGYLGLANRMWGESA